MSTDPGLRRRDRAVLSVAAALGALGLLMVVAIACTVGNAAFEVLLALHGCAG